MEIQSNSRQIPKEKTYTADKHYCDLLYGALQIKSYFCKEDSCRYVDKKDINFSKLGAEINLTRQTTSLKFKNLIKLGLIEYQEEEKRYKLNTLSREVAALVPYKTLRLMTNSLSLNCISLYVYFLNRYIAATAGGSTEYIVTMSQMKSFIGIATTTTSNDIVINDIMTVLKKIGLIEYENRKVEEHKTYIYITCVRNEI